MSKKQHMPNPPRHLRPPPPRSPKEESSHRRSTTSSTRISKTTKRHRIVIAILIFLVLPVISAYLYRKLYASYNDTSLPYVYKQGLVKKDVTYQEIINENAKVSEDTRSRRFPNPVLVYVTPWNSKGYDLAKEFNSKITHISPVWYDLKRYLGYDRKFLI